MIKEQKARIIDRDKERKRKRNGYTRLVLSSPARPVTMRLEIKPTLSIALNIKVEISEKKERKTKNSFWLVTIAISPRHSLEKQRDGCCFESRFTASLQRYYSASIMQSVVLGVVGTQSVLPIIKTHTTTNSKKKQNKNTHVKPALTLTLSFCPKTSTTQ